MRRLLRTLLPAAFLAALQAPLASGQGEQAYIYAYQNLSRNGGTVFGYADTDIAYPLPYNHCYYGAGNNCWEEYTSYAEASLYWDNDYLGTYWCQQYNGGASAWVYADVAAGGWDLEAVHEIRELWYLDAYSFEWYVPWMYDHQWKHLTLDPEISISNGQYAQDGDAASFYVTVELGDPTSYEWAFGNPSPAGNNPSVQFSDPYGSSTLTDARWYAHPDSTCSADHVATYWIEATVGFDSGTLSDWTWLWVNGWWDPAGWTGAPSLPIEAQLYWSDGLWRVHSNTQVQKLYSFSMIWVPGSSQFWYKTFVHEQEHRRQWEPGGLMGHLYNAAALRTRLLGLSAETQAGLELLIQQTGDSYMREQATLSQELEWESEREAWAQSDLYAPWYIYEGQCKGY